MGGATFDFYLQVLRETVGIIRSAEAEHLVIGGIAERVHFGRPLSPTEDIDVLIRRQDAEPLLEQFAERGFATHVRDATWIFKAARPDVTVDLIFRAGETIELDERQLARSRIAERDGVALRIPAPEDVVVMKAVFDAPGRGANWYTAVELLRRLPIDWDYLCERGEMHGRRRTLSLALYVADLGIEVPESAIARLGAGD